MRRSVMVLVTVLAAVAVVTAAVVVTLVNRQEPQAGPPITTASVTPGPSAGPSRTPTTTRPQPRSSPPIVRTPTTRPSSPAATPPSPSHTSTPTAGQTTGPTCDRPVAADLAGKVWTRIPTTRKVVALTFDGGADAAGAASILATLAREQVPATFFPTGAFAAREPALARAMARAGRIGNHTQTHPYLTQVGDAQVRRELALGRTTITGASGEDPSPWFRFPYDDRDARTLRLVNACGYAAVGWTVDTLGWQGVTGGRSTATVVARVLDTLVPGQIVLMHVGAHPSDRSTLDADALPQVIAELRARGYGFVTVDALTGSS